MDAREDHESLTGWAFDDSRCAIWKFGDHRAPSRKLGTILPVHVQRSAGRQRDFDRLDVDTLKFVGIKIKRHPRGEIHSVVNRISPEKSSRTNSQVMHTIILHRASDRRCRPSGQILTDRDRVSAWND